jgi:hypothetical protein
MCACGPALRPVLGRILSKKPIHAVPEVMGDSSTGAETSRSTPTLKPKAHVEYSMGGTCVWFDLEGIANDGLGYTVSISAGPGEAEEGGRRPWEEKKSRRSGMDVQSLWKRGMSRMAMTMTRARPADAATKSAAATGAAGMIEIVARRSLEITSSFREAGNNNMESIMGAWKSSASEEFDDWNDESSAVLTAMGDAARHLKGCGSEGSEPATTTATTTRLSSSTTGGGGPVMATSPPSSLSGRQWQQQSQSRSPAAPAAAAPASPASPAAARGRGPANPVNSSQWWAGPGSSPRARLSDESVEEDGASWKLETATRRKR